MKRFAAFLLLYSFVFHISTTNAYAAQIPKPEISGEAAVLMDADTGIILYQKNPEEKLYPASITKIMTALLTIEADGDQPDRRVKFSPEAVDLPYDSSSIAMNAGDTLSVREALYGLMISSANEVANALAENIGLTYNRFINMMNMKAAALGAKNTHFTNPSGLFDEDHYTCAYDMALIMREAVKNPIFLDAASKIYYSIPATETQSEERALNATNKLILPGSQYYCDYIKATKTGYTDEAQHTLVSYGEKDGLRLIAVVLHAEKNKNYEDTIALMEYGFISYQRSTILDASSVITSVTVVMDPENPKTNRSIPLYAIEDVEGYYPLCVTERSISLEYKIPEQINPPVNAGDPVGTLLVKYQGITLSEIGLYAYESVRVPEPTAAPAPTATQVAPVSDNTRYAGGFSFGFVGDILSSIVSTFSPFQLNPLYFMIVVIFASIFIMVYIMSVIIHSKNRNKEKELLKYVNRSRRK